MRLTANSNGSTARRRGVRMSSMLVAAGVVLATTGILIPANPVDAAPAALAPRPDTSVTADALPTVQVDGVVWSQAIVGTTVYAGGKFNNARPAGAAAGTNLTPRGNLLAFDITTGLLNTSFAPSLNGQVLAVAASPDGSRIYVTGDFTVADGQPRNRIAAYDTATGQLVASFAPRGPSAQGRALAVTNDAVYLGGGFLGSGVANRGNMLAVRASDGALLDWNPDADYTVSALALSADGSSIFAGGSFQNVGGQPAYGLAKIDAATGALQPWNATLEVRNAGMDAGVTSLRVANGTVYGTMYHFGAGGNLEGPFAASASTGDLVWAADCHGDTYSSAESNGVVYVVGHSHYCGNVGGGFPQPATWNFQRGLAFTREATGTALHEPYGYPKDWFGKPSPSIVHWIPRLALGAFTGQGQAAWSVTATDDYVVLGGEFPKVNNVAQQGLVRFGRGAAAPKTQGPIFDAGTWVPKLIPTSDTSLRVSWQAAYDRDDQTLTYKVIRNDAWGSPVFQGTASSAWWNLPAGGYTDTALTPGGTYKYRVTVSDPGGNTVFSTPVTITMPVGSPAQLPYDARIVADQPSMYWPLNDTAGPVFDAAKFTDGTTGTSLAFGQAGIDTGASVRLDGTSNSRIVGGGTTWAPNEFTAQAWIKTSTTSGGRILGFGDNPSGDSGHGDRQIYMLNDGRIAFGVWAGAGKLTVLSSSAYNDNSWHQITATFSAVSGMTLYVDGVRVATRPEITATDSYLGYWRVGGDNLNGWPNKPSKNDFTGNVDAVAVYPTVLTQAQIDAQRTASGRTSLLPAVPADAYGAAVRADQPSLYWRLSDTSGVAAADTSTSLIAGTYRGLGFTRGQVGAISGTTNAAVRSSALSGTFISSDSSTTAPQVVSVEIWFKTGSTQGGQLIGFGNNKTANSSTTDRHIYMQNDGKLVFGVQNGAQYKITSLASYNNNQWHHVVGTLSAAGMKLYVDGLPIGSNPQSTGQSYTGYWRVAGDTTWGSASRFLNGTFDEAAVYPAALSPAQVAQHYAAAGAVNPNHAPSAAFASSNVFLAASFDASASSDADGPLAGYAWNFGDGTTGSGVTASHTYAAAGIFPVTLTVTDSTGVIATVTQNVTVVANQGPSAAFGFSNDFLAASFDASASADPEGPLAGYAWNFGDGSTGSGVTVSHTYAAAGTYSVSLTVTDGAGATATATQNVTVAPNQVPSAAFGSSNVFLAASFDASASSDAEGPLVGYAWNFGDSATGSGVTVSHTYAAAGTYSVTLTVTDPEGVTATVTQDVTVVANQAPSAAFGSSSVFLAASFDASASADAEGPLVGYAWNFGDGATGSGVTASHTYAIAGTYPVTLTVTDAVGATAIVTQDVTVAGQQVLAADAMERTVTGGFGTADIGGVWTNSNPAANFSVANGRASMTINAAGGGASVYLNGVSGLNVDAAVDVAYDKVATGGGFYTSLIVRRVGTTDYRVKVRVLPTSTSVYLGRTVNGVETVLSSAVVPGTFAPGSVLHVRMQANGTGTTNLSAKAWYEGSVEPVGWTITATDSTPALQAAGAVGVYGYISATATNAPLATQLDNFRVGAL